MTKTEWKSTAELKHSLKRAKRVSILSCDGCAKTCGTGGGPGMEFLRGLLNQMGKEVLSARTVRVCCDEKSMKEALTEDGSQTSRGDTLVIASCAAGVKAACLYAPGVCVVPALDTMPGCRMATEQDNIIVNSICIGCDHCVLAYTGGICPLFGCPKKMKYGPCSKAAADDISCTVKPDRQCVWVEIAQRGDTATLKDLKRMHKPVRGDPGHLRKSEETARNEVQ